MSVQDLKEKFRQIPGIENLTVRLEGGKQVFSLGGPFVEVHPLATDAEVALALRSIAPPAAVTSTPLPTVNISPPSAAAPAPTGAPMSTTGTVATSIKELMEGHVKTMQEIHAAQVELLRASLKRQADSVSNAVNTVSVTIDGQTDDFLAIIGQFSNGI